MRRRFLKLLTAGAWAGMSLARAASLPRFDVLQQPALATRKAASAALLAVTRSGNRLVAVGERGIVLLSDDEGVSWRQARVPVSVSLTAVQFVDNHTGWAVGHLGVVLRTGDNGETWTVQFDGIRAAALAAKAATDAGQAAVASRLLEDGPDKPFLDLYFQDKNVGWVIGAYNLAFLTNDGGSSWECVMPRLPNPKGLHLYAVREVGRSIYITGEQGLLLRSDDHGQHFEALQAPSKGSYFGLVSGQKGELVLYGLRGRVFVSRDAAGTWSEVPTGSAASISAGLALDNGSLLLASQAGELLMSQDDGKSFRAVSNPTGLPITAMALGRNGALVATSLRGVQRLSLRSALT
ncbi:YCF48-related protein [Ideonella azotifigens]|uniref:YCF48-related protein n=2 Tax=Ideonella azotifigens TaxID=513160 RepID=A0ABN1KNE3_9BURK